MFYISLLYQHLRTCLTLADFQKLKKKLQSYRSS